MLTAFLLATAGAIAAGVGLVIYARRRIKTALPPVGLDIPKREELPHLLQLAIAAKIGKIDTDADKRFLSGAAYWKAVDEGLTISESVAYAVLAQDAILDIRVVETNG